VPAPSANRAPTIAKPPFLGLGALECFEGRIRTFWIGEMGPEMRRAMIVALIGVGATLAAGCGPSALQRRACDMYAEAGGGPGLADPPPAVRDGKVVPYQEWAVAAYRGSRNREARAAVSARLSISLREVGEALGKCGPAPAAEKRLRSPRRRRCK